MKTMLIARIRHLILGPGRHFARRHPVTAKVPMRTMDFILMFSGRGADRKYYPEKNGTMPEMRYWL